MFVKFYLDESEKLKLEEIAKARNVSLSRLCYDQIRPLFYERTLSPDCMDDKPDSGNYNKCFVKVYFSEQEYQSLVADADGLPLSKYMRNEYLSRKKPIEITIYTDDIASLSLQVSDYARQLRNFIAGLAIREQLYEADYQRLIQIASDTQKALRDVATAVKANRKSIRASGVRIIRKEIKRALEKQLSADKLLSSGKDGDDA